ncbi:MAG: tetratricopeptide repeat protein [Bdellovibrionota bacterium]
MRRSIAFIAIAVLGSSVYGIRSYADRVASPLTLTELRTTDGSIALQNLDAQIAGEQRLGEKRPLTVPQQSGIIELIAQRGQILGSISDYEKADALAAELVAKNPDDAKAYLTRASTHSTFHRFSDALADINAAEARGVRGAPIESPRASILQATGKYEEALKLRESLASRKNDIQSIGALATLYGEMGDLDKAEATFSKALTRYRDVSPFPVAWLYFQEGAMFMRYGELQRAREFFENAHERVPAYKAAQGHLAEVLAALGDTDRAIELLRPLASGADDPDYAAQLARILVERGQSDEASKWRSLAAARYDALMSGHPQAFADHACEFWLAAGDDAKKAFGYARTNLELRPTPRAHELYLQAALKAGEKKAVCDDLPEALKVGRPTPALADAIRAANQLCAAR